MAIRVWKAPLDIFTMSESGGNTGSTPTIGDPETIALYENAIGWHYIQLELFEYSLMLLRIFIAALCIFLWSRNRREKLFIWVAIYTGSPIALQILQGVLLIPFSYTVARCINQPLYVLWNISLWFLLVQLLGLSGHRRLVRLTRILATLTVFCRRCKWIACGFSGRMRRPGCNGRTGSRRFCFNRSVPSSATDGDGAAAEARQFAARCGAPDCLCSADVAHDCGRQRLWTALCIGSCLRH